MRRLNQDGERIPTGQRMEDGRRPAKKAIALELDNIARQIRAKGRYVLIMKDGTKIHGIATNVRPMCQVIVEDPDGTFTACRAITRIAKFANAACHEVKINRREGETFIENEIKLFLKYT